jgi:hypothetical protein
MKRFSLGEEYIRGGAIPSSEPEDAYHIAIATVNGIETLASWNSSISSASIPSGKFTRSISNVVTRLSKSALWNFLEELFMEIYKNSYSVKEDEVLWELHEISHELHDELKSKPLSEINKRARDTLNSWKTGKKLPEKEPCSEGHHT